MLVAYHHSARRERLHIELRKLAFRCLELVAVAAAATAARYSFGGRKRWNVVLAWSNQGDRLLRFRNLVYHPAAKDCQSNNRCQRYHVQHGRALNTVLFVVIETPDIPDRNRL